MDVCVCVGCCDRTEIEWKEGRCLTRGPRPSFFGFFESRGEGAECLDHGADVEDDLVAGMLVRDELVPQAVMLFCGEDAAIRDGDRLVCCGLDCTSEDEDEKQDRSAVRVCADNARANQDRLAQERAVLLKEEEEEEEREQDETKRGRTREVQQGALDDWASAEEHADKVRARRAQRRRVQRSRSRAAVRLYVGNVVFTQMPPRALLAAAGGARDARAQRATALLRLFGPHAVRLHRWTDRLHQANVREYTFVEFDSAAACAAALQCCQARSAADWAAAFCAAIRSGTPPWALPSLPLDVRAAHVLGHPQ